jgi:hypothetical protein
VTWLWHNDRRKGVWFAATLLLLSASLLLLMNALTSGGFYLNTVLVYTVHSYQVRRAAAMLRGLLVVWPAVVAVAGVAIVGTFFKSYGSINETSGQGRQPFVVYGLMPYTLGALISVPAAGKIGSDVNYLLEPIAAPAIWAALGVAWWPGWRRLRQHHAILLLTGQVIIMLFLGGTVSRLQAADKWARIGEYDRVFRHVQAAAQRGPILADEYLGMVVRAGHPIYYQSFDYQQLYLTGHWDPGQLISEIKARKFPLIMLTGRGRPVFSERWDPSFVGAIDQNYTPSETLGELVLYEPLKASEGGSR